MATMAKEKERARGKVVAKEKELMDKATSPPSASNKELPQPKAVPDHLPKLHHPELPPHQRVLQCASKWKQLGDQYVSSVAQSGLKLDWAPGFDPCSPQDSYRPPFWVTKEFLPEEVGTLVKEWLQEKSIEQVAPDVPKATSSIFAIPKKPKGWRLITNLRNVNAFLRTTKFQLPTLQQILPHLHKGMWATKIDIKSAYLHWPIHERDQPYLCFQFKGEFFMHKALPFGLAVAPREWQRAMSALCHHLRKQGVTLWVYLDDFLIIGHTSAEVKRNTLLTLQWLAELGVEVNYDKSELEPCQDIVYLGFHLLFDSGLVQVPKEKVTSTLVDLAALLTHTTPSARKLASVLGRLRSLIFALPQVRLLSDALAKQVHLQSTNSWETKAPISALVQDQMQSTMQELQEWKGRPFRHMGSQQVIYSDASDLAWGATLDLLGTQPLTGYFQDHKVQEHINYKEGLAVLEAIRTYNLWGVTLKVFTDNTTIMWYLKKWGGGLCTSTT